VLIEAHVSQLHNRLLSKAGWSWGKVAAPVL
jgi:hypothetical protein